MEAIEKALAEGYENIFGQPMTEGILKWLFGSNKSPSQRLEEKVNDIFDRFYEKNSRREERSMYGSSGSFRSTPYDMMRDVDSMRTSILSEIRKAGRQYDKAARDVEKATKARDKAYGTRDSYSDKLDYMRDDRDRWRKRYNEKRRDRSK